mgnify:CR=1 FL=1
MLTHSVVDPDPFHERVREKKSDMHDASVSTRSNTIAVAKL